jgi:hypothetical protein
MKSAERLCKARRWRKWQDDRENGQRKTQHVQIIFFVIGENLIFFKKKKSPGILIYPYMGLMLC